MRANINYNKTITVCQAHASLAKKWEMNMQAYMWISAYMYTYVKSIIHETYTYMHM
jgi:hypothetical protein